MQNKLNQLMQKLARDQRGLSTVEYVILLVLLVVMCVAVWNMFGNALVEKLEDSGQEFDSQVRTSDGAESINVNTEKGVGDWDGMRN